MKCNQNVEPVILMSTGSVFFAIHFCLFFDNGLIVLNTCLICTRINFLFTRS